MQNPYHHIKLYMYDFRLIMLISFIITLYNLFTIGHIIGLCLTIVQYIIVLVFILNKKIDYALFWHLFFISTSISTLATKGLTGGDSFLIGYNYATLKFVGPVSCSYLMSIFILVFSFSNHNSVTRKTFLKKLLNTFLFLAISGNVLGILGFLFSKGYSTQTFIKFNVYIWFAIITLQTSIKNNKICRLYFHCASPLLCGCILATFTAFLFGVRTTYSVLEVPLSPDILFFAPILFVGLLYANKYKPYIIISLFLLLYLDSIAIGGKSVFFYVFIICTIVYMFFSKKHVNLACKHTKKIRFVLIALLLYIATMIPTILNNKDVLTGYKIYSALSIFSGEFDDISNSPAVRIAEFCNILYNNRNDMLHLFFGNGYGGYFTDELNLLSGLDLSGGWSEEVISSGRYPTAHDTWSVVPLVNGIIGLFIIIYIAFYGIKEAPQNYLLLTVVPWLLLAFYANPHASFIALFFLSGSTYMLPNKESGNIND